MHYLYIDESGSMTSKYTNTYPYFVISMIHTEKPNYLKKIHKRFIQKHLTDLADADKNTDRMFKNGKFEELKGSSFTPKLKKSLFLIFVVKIH